MKWSKQRRDDRYLAVIGSDVEVNRTAAGSTGIPDITLPASRVGSFSLWTHRRKLLLGPGAQAPPHFYDHGARLYDEPPTFVT